MIFDFLLSYLPTGNFFDGLAFIISFSLFASVYLLPFVLLLKKLYRR